MGPTSSGRRLAHAQPCFLPDAPRSSGVPRLCPPPLTAAAAPALPPLGARNGKSTPRSRSTRGVRRGERGLEFPKNIYKTKRLTWPAGRRAESEPRARLDFLIVFFLIHVICATGKPRGRKKKRESPPELRGGRSSSARPGAPATHPRARTRRRSTPGYERPPTRREQAAAAAAALGVFFSLTVLSPVEKESRREPAALPFLLAS